MKPLIFGEAVEQYAAWGVDVEHALATLSGVAVSLHCWQGDDVSGFESTDRSLGGGLVATGNYPGKARTPDQLRHDLDFAYRLIPGRHRLNLHAIYLDTTGKVERNAIAPEHFASWVDWAKAGGHGLDFNPTCFSHPLADSGFTLSHEDAHVRRFWIEHCIACRRIGHYFGKSLGTPCVTNVWIPDGYKDTPADRLSPRARLRESLDEIFTERLDHNLDAVESKLFGIGSESYVVGSHEFYLGYAVRKNIMVCLDAGHFHPTESLADKLSSCLIHLNELLLHVSRGVRWDSDHVVTYTDDLAAIAQELVRCHALGRVHIGLDYFDASINRVAAWVIGTRNMLRAILSALLEPTKMLMDAERSGDLTARLTLQEEAKCLPANVVWQEFCSRGNVPFGRLLLEEIRHYEASVLAAR